MNWYNKLPEWLRWLLFCPIFLASIIIALFFTEFIFKLIFEGLLGFIIPKKIQPYIVSVAIEPAKAYVWLTTFYCFFPRWKKLTEKIIFIILMLAYTIGPVAYFINGYFFKSSSFTPELNAEFTGYIFAIPVLLYIHSRLKNAPAIH